jgi:hypothetical protein
MLKVLGSIPIFLFHFLTSLLQRGKSMLVNFVSFLYELATERKTMLVTNVSFFNELATKKKNYARGCFLIMASKRIMLWKGTMSRDKTRSWLPRDLHQMEENHYGRNTCRGSR